MQQYIWQNSDFPNFTYDKNLILSLLADVKLKQGILLGKMASIGFVDNKKTVANVLAEDVIKSNEIEGLKLNIEQVRSSVSKRLGLDIQDDIYVERDIEGIVEANLDAIQNYDTKLTHDRLFSWQASMFPTDRSGLYKIKTGEYRDDKNGAMQIVSGAIGHEKVHYIAPPADIVKKEMDKLIDYFNHENETDFIIKAGIIHLWFVIIHPFEDGNGRIARTLTDMLLARSEKSSNRYYSMSSQINKSRKSYYDVLKITQKNSLDITDWLKWFLENVSFAIQNSDELLKNVYEKNDFWKKNASVSMNERQTKMINLLLDNFEGKLTTSKWAKICHCSQDTATRDITNLIEKGILEKLGTARATHYIIKN